MISFQILLSHLILLLGDIYVFDLSSLCIDWIKYSPRRKDLFDDIKKMIALLNLKVSLLCSENGNESFAFKK
jgi:hypothetical protein